MGNRNYSESIVINRAPEDLYAMVTDVSRMGEWSPICKECWWDEGATAEVGAWFSGRNVDGDATWETRSEVIAATPGEEFAWIVGGSPRAVGVRLQSRRRRDRSDRVLGVSPRRHQDVQRPLRRRCAEAHRQSHRSGALGHSGHARRA